MFYTELDLIAQPQPDLWRLNAPLVWCDPQFGPLEVPAGFITDLASIPRLFRNLPFLDPNGISRRPATMHDWLYGSPEGRARGKQFADDFLRAALRAEGASASVAQTFYLAVHWGGQSSWDLDGRQLRDFGAHTG